VDLGLLPCRSSQPIIESRRPRSFVWAYIILGTPFLTA
jgi:hypothetical protein